MKLLTALLITSLLATSASGITVTFDLQGTSGSGLLAGNSVSAISTSPSPVGTGGELLSGIVYDSSTMMLDVHVGWGSGNGFSDLSGNATVAHIHGPASQSETAGVVFNLLGGVDGVDYSQNASTGFVNDSFLLTAAQETQLYAGDYYINIHTSQNPAGEIRGNLVATSPIPEPSTYVALAGLLGLAVAIVRRRKISVEAQS